MSGSKTATVNVNIADMEPFRQLLTRMAEIHEPFEWEGHTPDETITACECCTSSDNGVEWPCETIQALLAFVSSEHADAGHESTASSEAAYWEWLDGVDR